MMRPADRQSVSRNIILHARRIDGMGSAQTIRRPLCFDQKHSARYRRVKPHSHRAGIVDTLRTCRAALIA